MVRNPVQKHVEEGAVSLLHITCNSVENFQINTYFSFNIQLE